MNDCNSTLKVEGGDENNTQSMILPIVVAYDYIIVD